MPNAGDVEAFRGDIVGFKVATGQSVTKGQLVYISGPWEITPCSQVDHPFIGVTQNAGEEGEEVEVLMMCPIVYVVAGVAITAGQFLVSHTTAGRVQPLKLDAEGAGILYLAYVCGQAVEDQATIGEVVAMAMFHGVVKDTGT